MRFAYRLRFASCPADWLVERSAARGARVPAGLRPDPIGGERSVGLCYFDRRDRAFRSSALAAPVLGTSYVASTPNEAYRPGASAHTGPVAGAPRAAARPWHSHTLGELLFGLDGVATVVCYFADGLFAVYDERQDLTYWETPPAFGRRLCQDLAATRAAGPAKGQPPSRVLLLTDFDAISDSAREQVAQELGGPESITVNVPSTLFLDEASKHGAPRARIALLPATSGHTAPVWTATTTAGTSTTLSPAPGDMGDRINRALPELGPASAQHDVPSLVEPGTSFDEVAGREQSAAVPPCRRSTWSGHSSARDSGGPRWMVARISPTLRPRHPHSPRSCRGPDSLAYRNPCAARPRRRTSRTGPRLLLCCRTVRGRLSRVPTPHHR
ncbi:hypothetical protein [Streptomyces sp. AC627_RSS907]|uniref:hypothetical protein n=1 Tax=Streptomyces sp. AC627_RSS907 TaxID=2823684 RepID=UPI001C2285B6|nr:hypothetical protein [Streptomyces sp. AC627_RSS907]